MGTSLFLLFFSIGHYSWRCTHEFCLFTSCCELCANDCMFKLKDGRVGFFLSCFSSNCYFRHFNQLSQYNLTAMDSAYVGAIYWQLFSLYYSVSKQIVETQLWYCHTATTDLALRPFWTAKNSYQQQQAK